MYYQEIKTKLKRHLTHSNCRRGIFVSFILNEIPISEIQFYRILLKLEKEKFLNVELKRQFHPKKKPTKFYSINKN